MAVNILPQVLAFVAVQEVGAWRDKTASKIKEKGITEAKMY